MDLPGYTPENSSSLPGTVAVVATTKTVFLMVHTFIAHLRNNSNLLLIDLFYLLDGIGCMWQGAIAVFRSLYYFWIKYCIPFRKITV